MDAQHENIREVLAARFWIEEFDWAFSLLGVLLQRTAIFLNERVLDLQGGAGTAGGLRGLELQPTVLKSFRYVQHVLDRSANRVDADDKVYLQLAGNGGRQALQRNGCNPGQLTRTAPLAQDLLDSVMVVDVAGECIARCRCWSGCPQQWPGCTVCAAEAA